MTFLRENYFRSEKGAVLVETLIVMPVLLIFTVGVLEFGNVLWQRHQVQTGVRDAARYWSRCSPDPIGTSWAGGACTLETAATIAMCGGPGSDCRDLCTTPAATGKDRPRVRNWVCFDPDDEDASQLSISRSGALVVVSAGLSYDGSPLFGLLGVDDLQINYTHTERYIGW